VIAAAVLVAFSTSGLMAGGLTFKLTGGLSPVRQENAPPETTTQTHLATKSPTPTSPPTEAVTQPFTLALSVAPNPVAVGHAVRATISASNTFTHAPIAGLRCYLENPEEGGAPLLESWPPSAVTNSAGLATWTFTLPQTAPGIYEIGFTATGDPYRYHGQVSVSVISGS
jgi:hypothetical protein